VLEEAAVDARPQRAADVEGIVGDDRVPAIEAARDEAQLVVL
jgi:hypothetical protein